MEKNKAECPICLDHLSEEPVAVLGLCCHQYHVSCLEEWFRTKHKLVCPICNQESLGYYRTTIFTEDIDPPSPRPSPNFIETSDTDEIMGNLSDSEESNDSIIEGNNIYDLDQSSGSGAGETINPTTDDGHSSSEFIGIDNHDNSNHSSESDDTAESQERIITRPRTRPRTFSCRTSNQIYDTFFLRNNEQPTHDKISEISSSLTSDNASIQQGRAPSSNNNFYVARHRPRYATGHPRVFQRTSPRYNRSRLSTISFSSDHGSTVSPPLPPSTISPTREKNRRCTCIVQ